MRGDGCANYFMTGVDRNRDGVPDFLQSPGTIGAPSVALPFTTLGAHASYDNVIGAK